MVLVLYLLAILVLLLQAVFFGGSVIYSIIVILFSAYFIFSKYFLKRKFAKIEYIIYIIIPIAVIFVALLGFKTDSAEESDDFEKEYSKIIKLIDDEKYNKAEDEIARFEKKYGESDRLYMLWAIDYLAQGDYDNAENEYSKLADKDSTDSYSLKEQILVLNPATTQDELEEFYEDAAKKFPEWESMQTMCGYIKLGKKEYKEAEYYLTNAYTLNNENPMTCYYLGAVFYYENKLNMALDYFDKAIEYGVDEDTKSNIAWFLNEMGFFN